MTVETFVIGGMQVSWNPDIRVLRYHYAPNTTGIGQNGVRIVTQFEKWIDEGDGPIGVLSNGLGLIGFDALYRKVLAEFYIRHAQVAYLAVYNYGLNAQITAELWAEASNVNLKSFDNEGDAVSWLREQGFRV